VLSHSENGSSGHSGEIKFHLVDVAPTPVFAGLDGSHDGVVHGMKMLGSVLVLGRIAAAHVAADHAQPEMDPGVAHLQALFTAVGVGLHVPDLVHVTTVGHLVLLSIATS
jgi:hypothetical protein